MSDEMPPATPSVPGTPSASAAAGDPGTRTYEEASGRIEDIIRRLDSGDAGLRETLELVREGRTLIEFCAGELDAVGRGLAELRLDELVARLQGESAALGGPADEESGA